MNNFGPDRNPEKQNHTILPSNEELPRKTKGRALYASELCICTSKGESSTPQRAQRGDRVLPPTRYQILQGPIKFIVSLPSETL